MLKAAGAVSALALAVTLAALYITDVRVSAAAGLSLPNDLICIRDKQATATQSTVALYCIPVCQSR